MKNWNGREQQRKWESDRMEELKEREREISIENEVNERRGDKWLESSVII